jgi:hypothetical protein
MSDPVGIRALMASKMRSKAVEGPRVQGTRKAESCIGFIENRLHG